MIITFIKPLQFGILKGDHMTETVPLLKITFDQRNEYSKLELMFQRVVMVSVCILFIRKK